MSLKDAFTEEELKLGNEVAKHVFKVNKVKSKPGNKNGIAANLVLESYRKESDRNERNYLAYKDRVLYNTSYSRLGEKYGTTGNNLSAIIKRINKILITRVSGGYGPGDFIIKGIKDGDTLDIWYSYIYKCCKSRGIDSIKLKEEAEEPDGEYYSYENSDLYQLKLSTRTYNSLRRSGIDTIDEAEKIVNKKYIRGIGEKSKQELIEKIAIYRESHKGE
ncbi:MAG: hypothetical protein J6A59_01555 [Lachnospiraceae bacterium]|nr:hypothetical protein [Lachnospiraceae bacterium]